MANPGPSKAASATPQKRLRLQIAMAWGVLLGSLTFAVGPLSTISSNPLLGSIQKVLMVFLFPGLIGAMAFGGNVHAFSLLPGAIINALFHFSACWLLVGIAARLKAKAKSRR